MAKPRKRSGPDWLLRWRRCKDEMPPEKPYADTTTRSERCLVVVRYGGNREIEVARSMNGDWLYYSNVTHWMLLPELPR